MGYKELLHLLGYRGLMRQADEIALFYCIKN